MEWFHRSGIRFFSLRRLALVLYFLFLFFGSGDLFFFGNGGGEVELGQGQLSQKTSAPCAPTQIRAGWSYKLLFHLALPQFPIGGGTVWLFTQSFFFNVWFFSPIEAHVCFMLSWKITESPSGLETLNWRPSTCLCVWMSCSHAMIILCGACTLQTVSPSPPLCGTISTLCDVQGHSSHNGNYVFSQPDWQLFLFLWWEPQSDEGGGSADLLHSCRVGWICARSGRKWLCAIFYIYVGYNNKKNLSSAMG